MSIQDKMSKLFGFEANLALGICIVFILMVSTFPVTYAQDNYAVPGEVIVGLNNIDRGALKDIENKGGKVLDKNDPLKALRIKVATGRENAFINALMKNPNVRYAEHNFIVNAVHIPNDPYLNQLWNMDKIQSLKAWDIQKGSSAIIVAVVDTGIDYHHVDLGGRGIILGPDWVSGDGDPMDDNGHGTHVAGIIAATMDNGLGVVGVAQVPLLAEKVLDNSGSGSIWAVMQGITDAADRGAKVINLSLGAPSSSFFLQYAVNYAWNKGAVVVGAAGNSNTNSPFYPAAYSQCIAVAATTRYDNKASYSNFGSYIELSAPGGEKEAPEIDWVYSTYIDNSYRYACGTSMAAPHVSGLAALILSQDPSMTNSEVRQHLRDTADDLGEPEWDQYYGYGRINAYTAISKLILEEVHDIAVTAVSSTSSVLQSETVTFDVTIENQGTAQENFDVVLIDDTDGAAIGSKEVTLSVATSATLNFDWDTTGATIGEHTITAIAGPIAGETDTSDNFKNTVVIVEAHLIDIAIRTIYAPASVTQSDVVDVLVEVENYGNQNVVNDFNVILYDDTDTIIIGMQTVSGLNVGKSETLTYMWDTAEASIGEHTLTASHDLFDDESSNDAKSTTVTVTKSTPSPPPPITTMHVSDLDGSSEKYSRSYWQASVTVTIHDESHSPLADATATGEWSGSRWLKSTVSGTTGIDGTVTFTTGLIRGGSITFTVKDITHSTLTYDASDNHDPDGDSDGAAIIINKP